MSGLIQTGTQYQNTAISGLVRQSADQQKIDIANQQLNAQAKMQDIQMGTELAGLAGLGILIAVLA